MTFAKILGAALAGSVVAGSAFAADLPSRKGPPPVMIAAPSVYNWSGVYVGLNAGAAFGQANVTTDTMFSPTGYFAATSPGAIGIAGAQKGNPVGFTGGAQAGFNWQFGALVAGVEADFQYFGLKSSTAGAGIYPCCAPTGFNVSSQVNTDWLLTTRGRLGLAMNNWLFYGTGGLAMANVKANYVFTDTFAAATETGSLSSTRLGWTIGGGVEWAFSGPWSVKVEYLHVELPSASTTSANLAAFVPRIAFPSNGWVHTARVKADIVRVGVNYRFNLGGPSAVVAKY